MFFLFKVLLLLLLIIDECNSINIHKLFKRSLSIVISSSSLSLPLLVNAVNNIDQDLTPSQLIQRGMKSFSNGQLLSSVEYFDEAKTKDPRLENYLWQRGLSLYYMNEFEDCATQFKKDVIVNKDDTEEAIWNMACQTNLNIENGKGIKEALEDARKNMLNIENERRPILMIAYDVFKGKQPIEKLIESAGNKDDQSTTYFYSKMYQSLLKDIEQDKPNGLILMKEALDSAYAKNSNDYMITLAKNHVKIREMEMEQ